MRLNAAEVRPQPMRAVEVKPNDRIEGAGAVAWKMGPLVAGEKVPHGGTLITFTDHTQMAVPNDLILQVVRP